MRMSAEFLPLYRLCGTSISSIAHSWNGRLYSVKRFQSAYARRTMILPFSRSRSRTSLSSNCLYCASLTPRAMFSKSMNIASFRSPFIPSCPFGRRSGRRGRAASSPIIRRDSVGARKLLEALYSGTRWERARRGREAADEADRSRPGRSRPTGTDIDGQVAGPHVRPHAAVRSRPLDVPLLRPGRARRDLDVAGVPEVAAGDGDVRHPLCDALVEAGQRLGGRADP